MSSVGMPRMLNLPAEFVFSSTFNFTTLILPAYAVAISATVGASMRQGLHHSAQKSTITGWVLLASMTSAWNVLSVTILILSAMRTLSLRGCVVILTHLPRPN